MTFATVAATLALSVAMSGGVASAATVVYEGTFPEISDSSIQLTFVKRDGKRLLKHYAASYITTCSQSGATPQDTQDSPFPRPRVRDGHFKTVQGSPDSGEFRRLVGDLKRHGEAEGVFRLRTTVGDPFGVCDTGALDWVAFKQKAPSRG